MSPYEIFITPRAWREVKALPGHMRQRIRREIECLTGEPRPPASKALTLPPPETEEVEEPGYELRRLRLDRWRIVYAVTESDRIIDILTVQKRPPYDYGDIGELLQNL